jgi:hypothetical protein
MEKLLKLELMLCWAKGLCIHVHAIGMRRDKKAIESRDIKDISKNFTDVKLQV